MDRFIPKQPLTVGILRRGVIWLALVLVAGSAGRAWGKDQENPPRYGLKVGETLEYRGHQKGEDDDDSASDRSSRLRCWVIAERPDKGWRLLFQYSRSADDQAKNDDADEDAEYGWFDLAADGRITRRNEILSVQPERYFPRLPDKALTAETTWQSKAADDWSTYEYSASPPKAGATTWEFTGSVKEPWDAVYLTSREFSGTFDLAQGLLASAEIQFESRYSDSKATTALKLVAKGQLPAAEATQLSTEAEPLLAAIEQAQTVATAALESKSAAELFEKAQTLLAKFEKQLKTPVLRGLLASKRAAMEMEREMMKEEADRFSKLIGQPSPDWKTTDLEGHPRGLKDFRGKVVVLDFWYRGCGWCMRAMPQMKQLAEQLKGRPVVFLGMNNDEDLDDAHLVIDAFKLPYQTLKNHAKEDDEGISSEYAIEGYPTIVLIDQKGVIRDYLVGFSPTLHDTLGSKINRLLDEKKSAATGAKGPADQASK